MIQFQRDKHFQVLYCAVQIFMVTRGQFIMTFNEISLQFLDKCPWNLVQIFVVSKKSIVRCNSNSLIIHVLLKWTENICGFK